MPSPVYYQLKPDDRKRLKRLKLALWFFTVLFLIHGMFGALKELYPITRWSMYSQTTRDGEFELTEGYFFRWFLVANLSDSTHHALSDRNLASQFKFNAASMDTIRLNFDQLSTSGNPDKQYDSATFFNEFLVLRYGADNVESFEIHRHSHLIDYSRFPSYDADTPDLVHIVARVSGDLATIEQIEEQITDG